MADLTEITEITINPVDSTEMAETMIIVVDSTEMAETMIIVEALTKKAEIIEITTIRILDITETIEMILEEMIEALEIEIMHLQYLTNQL